jgi:hypothetical protein
MTATTTVPGSRTTHSSNRPLWVALALALAAVIAITAAVVVLDDDGSSAGRATVQRETAVARPSAVPVSADAAEARAFPDHGVVQRSTGYQGGSADAAERAALAEQARDLRACTYSAAPPEAVERCLNGG